MNEEMENDMLDAEQLLRTKSWDQLSADERKAASETFSGEAEYERMRNMMLHLRAGAGIEEEELQPNDQIRENLLAAFEDEQRRRRVLWWNSLGYWFRDQLRLDIPAARIALAGVLLFIGIVTFNKLREGNSDIPQSIVKNAPVQPQPGPAPTHDITPMPQTPQVADKQQANDNSNQPKVVAPEPANNNDEFAVQAPQNNVTPGNNPAPVYQPAVIDTNAVVANAPKDSAGNFVLPTITVVTPTSVICAGTSTGTATVSGGTPAYTYSWTSGTSIGVPVTNITLTTSPPTNRSLSNDADVVNVFFALK